MLATINAPCNNRNLGILCLLVLLPLSVIANKGGTNVALELILTHLLLCYIVLIFDLHFLAIIESYKRVLDLTICRHQQERHHPHNFLVRFSDLKMAKQDMSEVSFLVSTTSPTNPNPKQASATKRDVKNKTANPKRFREAKSFQGVAPGFPSAGSAARQYPKSPLAFMHKKNQVKRNEVDRLLVTINVLGSAGPLRFLVSCDYQVQKVMEIALKSYAREGRLPVLGQNTKQFELHGANSDYGQALDPSKIIGALGIRNFLLCKKNECKLQQEEKFTSTSPSPHHQKTNLLKNWLNTMSSSFGISCM